MVCIHIKSDHALGSLVYSKEMDGPYRTERGTTSTASISLWLLETHRRQEDPRADKANGINFGITNVSYDCATAPMLRESVSKPGVQDHQRRKIKYGGVRDL